MKSKDGIVYCGNSSKECTELCPYKKKRKVSELETLCLFCDEADILFDFRIKRKKEK